MQTSRLAGALVCILLAGAAAQAQQEVWEIDPAHSSAQFSVRHMMVSNVRGEFSKLSGRVVTGGKGLEGVRVEAAIDATTIDTRNEGRDKHLRSEDFFDVAKYPTIEFTSTRIEPASEGTFRLIGNLTMHGVTKEIALDGTGPSAEIKDQRGVSHIGASATGKINRKDFNLMWNRALDGGGVVVGDEVSIVIDVELIKRSQPSGSDHGLR
jgi:polyisoprenoid-binding protein YceI